MTYTNHIVSDFGSPSSQSSSIYQGTRYARHLCDLLLSLISTTDNIRRLAKVGAPRVGAEKVYRVNVEALRNQTKLSEANHKNRSRQLTTTSKCTALLSLDDIRGYYLF
ncbi:hypothetical protein CHS0354_007493 [Potamilus streckersoni]|uniref:Uncharacterized protein n=1 Tax=Potamilus streckersoni TaxID=2493646 RepID=A0AAE0W8I4_9BIVA|nr:hypothetical protein CHS0354_007493 [Potamilus streckersoni]